MGILDDLMNPANQGALSLASNLLKAGGPSPYPVPLGAALGNAFGGFSKDQQQQALLNLEQQKAKLTEAQVNAALRDQAMREWAITGKWPTQFWGPQPGQGPVGAPALADASAAVAPPSGATAMPVSAPQIPQASGLPPLAGSPLAGLPPEAQNAIRLNVGIPGAGNIAWQASQPILGREGGIYRRTPSGGMELDPAWIAGERQRLELQRGIENQNTVVDVPLANGQSQRMTKAQELSLVNGTAQVKNMMPWADAKLIGSVQQQLIAEPDKPIDINVSLGGQKHQFTIPSLNNMNKGSPGMTVGQSTEARAAMTKSGENAGDVQNQIDQEASSALQSRKILGEMRTLSQDFTQGKVAPFKRALGEWAQALNLPGNWAEEIKGAESQQALQKLTAQMATAAMKQFTNRGTQMEFKTFLQNNPNAELTPGGFQKVLEFMDKTAQASLEKQQAYQVWRRSNPVERSQDFLAEWNKKQGAELSAPKSNVFIQKPPAQNYRGQRIRDTESGQIYESDGMTWKEVK